MPVKSKEHDLFVYILYNPESARDAQKLRRMVDSSVARYNGEKDFIVDFSYCDEIAAAEIRVIAKALTCVAAAKRYLRILCGDAIRELLQKSALQQRKYMVFYHNTQDFLKDVRKIRRHKDLFATPEAGMIEEIVLSGKLVFERVPQLSAMIMEAFQKSCKKIVLNLEDVTYIDSVFLGQLMFFHGKAEELKKTLVLLAPQGYIKQLFKDTSLDQVLHIQ